MIGAMISVARGKFSLDSLDRLLLYPEQGCTSSCRYSVAEAHGLQLIDITYPDSCEFNVTLVQSVTSYRQALSLYYAVLTVDTIV